MSVSALKNFITDTIAQSPIEIKLAMGNQIWFSDGSWTSGFYTTQLTRNAVADFSTPEETAKYVEDSEQLFDRHGRIIEAIQQYLLRN